MAQGQGTSYTLNRRLLAAKQHEYSIVDKFSLGFRAREDNTILPPGVMIEGSQNVLTNTHQRVGIRKGYSLDGAANSSIAPIGGDGTAMGVFDWVTSLGDERNMRAGFLTSAANDGKLQYRHIKSDGSIEWNDLLTGLTSVNFNYCTFYDTAKFQTVLLMASGETNIRAWNGIVGEVASSTSNTITMLDTTNVATLGFSASGTLVIGGVGYAYTGAGGVSNNVYTHTSTNATPAIDVATWHGQLFTTSGSATGILSATARVKSLAISTATAVFNAYIYSNNAGVPGNVLGSAQATIAPAFSTGDFDLTFNFVGIAASPATSYHLVLQHFSGGSFDVYIGNTGGVGTNVSIDSGTTWSAENGYLYATVNEATGASGPNVFYGVSPDASGITVGAAAAQSVITIANAGGTKGLPVNFKNQFIATITGVLFVGSSESSFIYSSDLSSYTQWTTASRFFQLNNAPTTFATQDEQLYTSTGTNQWFQITLNNAAAPSSSFVFNISPINTAALHGAQSQAMTTKISNSIAFVSFEPAIQSFGPVQNIFQGPQMVDFSYPIVNLMNEYDFTGGSIAYFRKFLYIAVPRENTVLVYNMTDPKNPYWEAPQILPIGRFSIIGGELYGHSSQVSETYKLFTGYADRATPTSNGAPISAKWVFSYENYGSRFSLKKATKMYVEGYISSGADLTANITYELDGCKMVKTFELDGSDKQFVCVLPAEGSLGKEPLGKVKLGGDTTDSGLPPKFRWMPTFSNTDFFECSVSFDVLALDNQVDILAFGLAVSGSSEIPVQNYD